MSSLLLDILNFHKYFMCIFTPKKTSVLLGFICSVQQNILIPTGKTYMQIMHYQSKLNFNLQCLLSKHSYGRYYNVITFLTFHKKFSKRPKLALGK